MGPGSHLIGLPQALGAATAFWEVWGGVDTHSLRSDLTILGPPACRQFPTPRAGDPSLSFPSCWTAKVRGQGCGMGQSSSGIKEDTFRNISTGALQGVGVTQRGSGLW